MIVINKYIFNKYCILLNNNHLINYFSNIVDFLKIGFFFHKIL